MVVGGPGRRWCGGSGSGWCLPGPRLRRSDDGCRWRSPSPTLAGLRPPPSRTPTTLLSGRRGEDGQVLAVKLDNTVNSHPHARPDGRRRRLPRGGRVRADPVHGGLLLAVPQAWSVRSGAPARATWRSSSSTARSPSPSRGPTRGSWTRSPVRPLYPLSNDRGRRRVQPQPGPLGSLGPVRRPDAAAEGCPEGRRGQGRGVRASTTPRRAAARSVREFTASWPSAQAQLRLVGEGGPVAALDGRRPGDDHRGPTAGRHHRHHPERRRVPVRARRRATAASPRSPRRSARATAWMFRDGQVWPITWSRPSAEVGHDLEVPGRGASPCDPGQVWILLLDDDRRPRSAEAARRSLSPYDGETSVGVSPLPSRAREVPRVRQLSLRPPRAPRAPAARPRSARRASSAAWPRCSRAA